MAQEQEAPPGLALRSIPSDIDSIPQPPQAFSTMKDTVLPSQSNTSLTPAPIQSGGSCMLRRGGSCMVHRGGSCMLRRGGRRSRKTRTRKSSQRKSHKKRARRSHKKHNK